VPVDPREIYVTQSAISDPEALSEAFIGWLDFLRDDAKFPAHELAPEALEIEAAWEYLGGVYNDFHALHFHNLLRNGRFDEAVPMIRSGLHRLDSADYVENFDEAVRLYQANKPVWDIARFGGASDEYRRAKAVMKPADDRFCELDKTFGSRKVLAQAISRLPCLRIVADDELAAVRQKVRDQSPRYKASQDEAAAREARRAYEDAEASRLRTEQSLKDIVAFAAEMLATGAGYTDVLTLGERHLDDDGSTEMWHVMLRTKDRNTQMNCLVRSGGRFGLFDHSMTTLRYGATEKDLERARQKLLRQVSPEQSVFRRLFGRKGV
jgi:hypothetical protein